MASSVFRVAMLSMASTNTLLIGSAPWLPPVISSRNGFPGLRGAIEKTSERTGQPVTMAFLPDPRRNFIASRDSCRNSRQYLVRETRLRVWLEDDIGYARQPG